MGLLRSRERPQRVYIVCELPYQRIVLPDGTTIRASRVLQMGDGIVVYEDEHGVIRVLRWGGEGGWQEERR